LTGAKAVCLSTKSKRRNFGSSAAFLSAGGYHHHLGLNTWESAGGQPPAEGSTGLYHLAIAYPTRAELGDALRRLQNAGIPLEGASDHGVSEALYCRIIRGLASRGDKIRHIVVTTIRRRLLSRSCNRRLSRKQKISSREELCV
jgi:catechol-2,3-dioxygenase